MNIYPEMQSSAFWDTILRNVTVCPRTLSCLDNFSNIITYILYTIFFLGGRLGILGGKLLPLKYPRYNPAFSFHLKFGNPNQDLDNKSSSLNEKARQWSILVVVINWRHCANGLSGLVLWWRKNSLRELYL